MISDIANDISKLIYDIFRLLESRGCHPPCYCPGTLIRTAAGETPVEQLQAGDMVITASGEARAIRWVGRRSFDIGRHAVPASVRPVRIAAGAFGEHLPRRDLVVSPGHSLFVDGVLIPVRFLINGATIVQDNDTKAVTYYHVELETHDVLLAEGLAAESYLDTGNRRDFENGGQAVELHPTFESKDWAETYAPLVKSGPTVESVKRRLIDRAKTFGFFVTEEHDLHLLADGEVIEPTWDGRRYHFSVPEGCSDLRLASKNWVPAHLSPESQDDRELGVCVARLDIDGEAVSLDTMSSGWHWFDQSGGTSYRWTTGLAELPSHGRSVTVELCGTSRYWATETSREANVMLLQAA